MPFLVRYPREIAAGTICDYIISNVDFAPTFLDFAQLRVPTYMQGVSFRTLLRQNTPEDWQQVAYHRYWVRCSTGHRPESLA
jgi:arylsulfatase A-like enzyme